MTRDQNPNGLVGAYFQIFGRHISLADGEDSAPEFSVWNNFANNKSRKYMINSIGKKMTLTALLVATILGLPLGAIAQDNNTTTNTTPDKPAAKKSGATAKKSSADAKKSSTTAKSTTFKGTLALIDKVAKTITIENKTEKPRVLQVTSETKILKGDKVNKDKPATLDDGTIGENVTGSYTEASGKLTLKTLYFRGKTDEKPKAAEKAKPADTKKTAKKDAKKDAPVTSDTTTNTVK